MTMYCRQTPSDPTFRTSCINVLENRSTPPTLLVNSNKTVCMQILESKQEPTFCAATSSWSTGVIASSRFNLAQRPGKICSLNKAFE